MFNTYSFTGPPALTVNITKNIENSTIVVQWDAVDNFLPTTYTIQWTDGGDVNGLDTVEEQTSYTITGLTLDTIYTITIGTANMCGDGPEFQTKTVFSMDANSATSTISPTGTASTNTVTIISTANPSSDSNPSSTTTITHAPRPNSITTTVNGNADISASRNSDISITTTTTATTTTTTTTTTMTTTTIVTTTIAVSFTNATTTDETSKFSVYIHTYLYFNMMMNMYVRT